MITPRSFELGTDFLPESYDNHIERRLSAMEGQYRDGEAFRRLRAEGDPVLYEVYELGLPAAPGRSVPSGRQSVRPEGPEGGRASGDLLSGISIVHPGKVGNEYYMTKGHFHAILETAEVYHCLAGRGKMVMETPEGDWAVEDLLPGRVLYVPPRWAHRTVNTGERGDLVTLFVYPAGAGHDYATIEKRGFRKLVLDLGHGPAVVDNPAWG